MTEITMPETTGTNGMIGTTEDTAGVPVTTPGFPETPEAKTRRVASDAALIASGRRARKRLGKMLDGATSLKTSEHLKGPIAFAVLQKLCGDFDAAEAAVTLAPKQGSTAAEALHLATRQVETRLKAVLEFVDVLYPPGNAGRALFFPVVGQRTLVAEWEAALAGLKADQAGLKLLPVQGATDVKAGTAALEKLKSAEAVFEKQQTTHDGQRSLRNSCARSLRTLTPMVEQFLRTYHRETPPLLLKYDIKPGVRAVDLSK